MASRETMVPVGLFGFATKTTRVSGRIASSMASRSWTNAAIGTVTNLASRLCDKAQGGQVLISQRVYGAVEELVDVEPLGELALKGLHRPVNVYNLVRVKE